LQGVVDVGELALGVELVLGGLAFGVGDGLDEAVVGDVGGLQAAEFVGGGGLGDAA